MPGQQATGDTSSQVKGKADVIVVGAGISGFAAARELVKAGLSVVVLEVRDQVSGRLLKKDTSEGGWVDLGGQ